MDFIYMKKRPAESLWIGWKVIGNRGDKKEMKKN